MFGRAIASVWAAILAIPMRGWIAAAVCGLTWRIIELVADNPALLQESAFMQLITPIAGAGGFLLIVSFLFASTKESTDKTETVRENAKTLNAMGVPLGRRASDPPPEGEVGDLNVRADTVNVETK